MTIITLHTFQKVKQNYELLYFLIVIDKLLVRYETLMNVINLCVRITH